jgi:NADH dehydrogenase
MILVVGATGTLGAEICHRLRGRQINVRALVRGTADPARLESLREAGFDLCQGDLKDVDSLRGACSGVYAVISTASSTLSRQQGDSIETVDRLGQLSLIEAATKAGVKHFTLVSIPQNTLGESPLTRAKAEVQRSLAGSGMAYTILAANYFMEIWLSPALGFDYPHHKVVVFGEGRAPISWVSYRDVAEFALRSHLTPGAHNRILDVGGPQDLSPLDVVEIFERASGAPFERQFVPEEALLAQLGQASDPLAETFAKLQLEYAHGCVMNPSQLLQIMPLELASVEAYAAAVLGQTAVAV